MPYVDSTIPNLVGGVSQQPPALRFQNQGDSEVNGHDLPDVGQDKRPPLEHVAKIINGVLTNPFTHCINRDSTERYEVVIGGGTLTVNHVDGTTRTVTFPNGSGYLTSSSPRDDFRAVTIADYTFIVNRSKVAIKLSTLSTQRAPEAMVYVKLGQYGTFYKVYIDGTLQASYQTPNGSVATDRDAIDTTAIAGQLKSQLNTNVGGTFTINQYGSVLHIFRINSAAFTIKAEDGFGDTALFALKDTTQKFTDLPPYGPNGFTIQIAGDNTNEFNSYWLQLVAPANGDGRWVETVAPGIACSFDPATMPHQLVRNSDGTFTFQEAAWIARAVGDGVNTAVDPTFVGKKINLVFFHKNRLGFLAGENTILSRAGEFFNFWPLTATAVVDSDPVDESSGNTQVSTLYNVAFLDEAEKGFVLFSAEGQYSFTYGDTLTPKSAGITPGTKFENNTDAAPISVGRRVYFSTVVGSYSGLMEFDSFIGQKQTEEVTKHVRTFIPSGVFKTASSQVQNVIVEISPNAPNSLWVYKYLFDNDKRVQSAHVEWRLDAADTILGADFIQTTLYLVIQRSDGIYIDKINFDPKQQDAGSAIRVLLDRKVAGALCAPSYSSLTNLTTWSLPYSEAISPNILQVVTAVGGAATEGSVIPNIRSTPTSISVTGDYTAQPVWIGRQYEHRYRFSTFFRMWKQNYTGAVEADTQSKTMLSHLVVSYSKAGYFRVEITPYGRDTQSYAFTGQIIGQSPIGAISLPTGDFKVPVKCRNTLATIELVNDSPLPCRFVKASWDGTYSPKTVHV